MCVYMCECVCEKLIAAHCGTETGMFRACGAFCDVVALSWLSARLQYLQFFSKADTVVLH